MARPIHFEIPADNPERAIGFYQKAFGWKIQKWEGPMPYWLVQTGEEGPGIDGGLHLREHAGQGTVNTIGVTQLDEAVRQVQAAGGKVAAPKVAIPGVGWLAYCTDTEGNTFGLMQSDPAAA